MPPKLIKTTLPVNQQTLRRPNVCRTNAFRRKDAKPSPNHWIKTVFDRTGLFEVTRHQFHKTLFGLIYAPSGITCGNKPIVASISPKKFYEIGYRFASKTFFSAMPNCQLAFLATAVLPISEV